MTARLAPFLLIGLLAACSRGGELSETGGVYVVRSACPQAGVAEGADQITLADAAGTVTARISNVRAQCSEDSTTVVSTATFDVSASRSDAGAARQVVLPTFTVALQGGAEVAAKRVARVALNFAAGSQQAQASGSSTVRLNRSIATLPADVRSELTRRRDPGEADAAVDPMSDPKIRDAVARATFEHLVGFQGEPGQLR